MDKVYQSFLLLFICIACLAFFVVLLTYVTDLSLWYPPPPPHSQT